MGAEVVCPPGCVVGGVPEETRACLSLPVLRCVFAFLRGSWPWETADGRIRQRLGSMEPDFRELVRLEEVWWQNQGTQRRGSLVKVVSLCGLS